MFWVIVAGHRDEGEPLLVNPAQCLQIPLFVCNERFKQFRLVFLHDGQNDLIPQRVIFGVAWDTPRSVMQCLAVVDGTVQLTQSFRQVVDAVLGK